MNPLFVLPTLSLFACAASLRADEARWNVDKTNWDSMGLIDQPEFFTSRITTSMLVRVGEWKLLTQFVVPESEPHVELFLIRSTAHSLVP